MGSYGMLARRVVETEMPIMVQIQQLIRGAKNAVSLAQGVVYWKPPKQALEKVKELVEEPSISCYGADEGLPELRQALIKKLGQENDLHKSSVMVTAGANQAFVNLALALCDAGDSVVMFAPYYFNAYMSFQMTGVTKILVGPGNPKTLYPDAGAGHYKLIINSLSKLLHYFRGRRIPDICKNVGCWLVVDNTYEYFMYDDLKHSCLEGNHIVNIFSFSKAYGMMGWRVGYIAYPTEVEGLATQLLKVQGGVQGGEGAIYLWATLPEKYLDDVKVVHWLAHRHGVVVIPGSACGSPGHLRIAFDGLMENDCRAAAEKLKKGLEELVKHGLMQ